MSGPALRSRGTPADVWAGLAGGLFAPVATFGLGLPLWASLPGAILVFAGARLALGPRDLLAGLDEAALSLAHDVIAAAQADLVRLKVAAQGIRNPAVRRHLDHQGAVAERVVAEVARRPGRLTPVRRLLTYYLPASVRLGEGYRTLERTNRPDAARLAATAGMIEQLDSVFASHADRLSAPEIEGLDVELKLLSDAIRTDERGIGAAPEATPWR
ncbi:hypothetical protein MFUR16E_22945 [Methylobacterium fujisawaense]|uniref:5-bromo-4-chloroindolyl phosphate hydrolysis family protein n=1 Tax=Methylobacterium fujisawaense TaxID=107400 RepID=UPI002F34A6C4